MARDRARDTSRVYQNPISHVNVLPNQQDASPDDGNMGYGNELSFKKNWKDKRFSDASGVSRYHASGRHEYQSAEVSTRGAYGHSSEDHETANAARRDAYNDASSEAVNKRKEITKKSADNIEAQNKARGKAKVVKVRS
jgi:hypothetical protein